MHNEAMQLVRDLIELKPRQFNDPLGFSPGRACADYVNMLTRFKDEGLSVSLQKEAIVQLLIKAQTDTWILAMPNDDQRDIELKVKRLLWIFLTSNSGTRASSSTTKRQVGEK